MSINHLLLQRIKRLSRKWCMVGTLIILFLIILTPSYFRHWWFQEKLEQHDTSCNLNVVPERLLEEVDLFNAMIDNYQTEGDTTNNYLPFIGNGYFGVAFDFERFLHLKYGRTLSLAVPYDPIYLIKLPRPQTERDVVHYKEGIVRTFACYHDKLHISNEYYAHRTFPNILVQEITVRNLIKQHFAFDLVQKDLPPSWKSQTSSSEGVSYKAIIGEVADAKGESFFTVCIVSRQISEKVDISGYETKKVILITNVEYVPSIKMSSPNDANRYGYLITKAISNLKLVQGKKYDTLKSDHVQSWLDLWNTGISVDTSKALKAYNGYQINATMYYVLSSSRSWLQEEGVSMEIKNNAVSYLNNVEGCYGSNHGTLQAENLWSHLSDIKDVNNVVNLWLLTLEKQGCHNFVKSGASGIMQGMVLSMGSFHFSKHHLAFNMHPSYFFRNYKFRRIHYGNYTRINITIEVLENYKAVLYVVLDRSDKPYYACDAGCLNEPVPISNMGKMFPVKLTTPYTALLYISPDKEHIADLGHALHVKEVTEAPAQEHNKMVLHFYGHNLKGLPTFFWITICTLILIFHLFLIKLILTEFKNQNMYKPRSNDSLSKTSIRYRSLISR